MPYLATVAPFGFADFNPPTLLALYRQLGCKAGQFYRNTDNPPQTADARHIAEDAGLPFDSMHGVFGKDYDPSSPDEAVRSKAVETYRREGDLALQLGGPVVIVHPAAPAADASEVTEQSRAVRIAPLAKSMEQLAAFGQQMGVTYLFENIPGNYHFGCDIPQLAQLVRDIDSPNIRMCFDTGHAHMTSNVVEALETCVDIVSYFHVHDNDGIQDSHQVPGGGTIPWSQLQSVVATTSVDTPAMLELFEPESSLQAHIEAGLGDRLAAWLALSPATAK